MLGFNDTSTLVGHFVSSPREREKRDRRDERERQGRKRKMNESEDTEELKTFSLYQYLLQGQQALPNCKPTSVERPVDARYTTPLPHPTTPDRVPTTYVFVKRQSTSNEYPLPVFSWQNKKPSLIKTYGIFFQSSRVMADCIVLKDAPFFTSIGIFLISPQKHIFIWVHIRKVRVRVWARKHNT